MDTFSLISESSRQVGSLFSQILNGSKNIYIAVYSYVLLKVSILMTLNAFFYYVLSILVKAFLVRLKIQLKKQ